MNNNNNISRLATEAPSTRTVAQPNYKLANQRKECNKTSWKHVEDSMPSMNRSIRNF